MANPRPSKAMKSTAFSLTLLSMANARRDQAVKVMGDQVNGYGSGGGNGRSSGHSDPTPLLVEKRDKAQEAMAREEKLRRQLERLADEYAALIAGWSPAVVADAQTQVETEKDNKPKCEACAAAIGEAVDYHRRTDMGGVLGYPMWLCGWHIKRVQKTGRLPTDMEVHDHYHRRERVAS